jgi:hypothetical protein
MKTEPQATCSAPVALPWWKIPLLKIWPWQHQDLADLPPWAKDALYVENRVELSFADRLRVLLSGRLRVRSRTLTENVPGRVVSDSIAHPLPPKWLQP